MKCFRFIVPMTIFLCIFSFDVFAFKTAPFFVCEIDPQSIPDGSCYLDMLVRIKDLTSNWYLCDANVNQFDFFGFDETAPIATYLEDGYVSYMFHCKDAVGNNRIPAVNNKDYILLSFGEDEDQQFTEEMMSLLKRLKHIRFAYLDKDGNILSVTEDVRPNKENPFLFREEIRIQGETVHVSFTTGPPYWLIPCGALGFTGCVVFLIVWTKRKNKRQQ